MTDNQMRDADAEMHRQMAELYRQQALSATSDREAYPDTESFINRTLVHCKLDRETYASLWAWAKARELSLNSAIKQILQVHFNTP